jgi:hypothetical protein
MGNASQVITRQHRLAQFFRGTHGIAQFFIRTHGDSQPDSMITAQIGTVPKELRNVHPSQCVLIRSKIPRLSLIACFE